MTIKLLTPTEFVPHKLQVKAFVRYWEDAGVNGHPESDECPTIPMRKDVYWCPEIDIIQGKVINWPDGVTAEVHYKVCDEGEYWLVDGLGRRAKYLGDYVPTSLLCHGEKAYGDYIILSIAADGTIQNWKAPELDANEWELE